MRCRLGFLRLTRRRLLLRLRVCRVRRYGGVDTIVIDDCVDLFVVLTEDCVSVSSVWMWCRYRVEVVPRSGVVVSPVSPFDSYSSSIETVTSGSPVPLSDSTSGHVGAALSGYGVPPGSGVHAVGSILTYSMVELSIGSSSVGAVVGSSGVSIVFSSSCCVMDSMWSTAMSGAVTSSHEVVNRTVRSMGGVDGS